MSSGEAGTSPSGGRPDLWQGYDVTPEDIAAFRAAGNANAYQLLFAKKSLEHDVGWRGPNYEDLQALVGSFETWKKNKASAEELNQKYITLAKGQPGRAGTVLTQSGPAIDPKTILGATPNAGKTVLG